MAPRFLRRRGAAYLMTVTRRGLLGGGAAAVATTLHPPAHDRSRRTDTLIRGGHLLTFDPRLGELPRGDILLQGDTIAQVGERIQAHGRRLTVVDAGDKIVLPGLIDNHRHLWVTLLRGFSADHSFDDYFAQVLFGVSPRLTPDDVYLGCLLGAYEALNTGVTTVLDWNHATYTREHALAAVRALHDSRVRAVFAYSSPAADSTRPDAPPSVDDVAAVRDAIRDHPLLSLAIATRNPEWADEAQLGRIADDVRLARSLDAIVTLHSGFGGRSAAGWLAEQGLLDPAVTFVHGNAFPPTDLRLIADAGAWISVSPETELQMGLGAPPLRAMLAAGLLPTVSVDVVAAAAGDLREQLRLLLQTQRMLDHAAGVGVPLLPAASMLPYVTGNAAGSLGLAGRVGALSPGFQADLVLINRADPSVLPAPAPAAVLFARASAVDTVFVAGRMVKRHGRLLGVDLHRLRLRAEAARRRLLG